MADLTLDVDQCRTELRPYLTRNRKVTACRIDPKKSEWHNDVFKLEATIEDIAGFVPLDTMFRVRLNLQSGTPLILPLSRNSPIRLDKFLADPEYRGTTLCSVVEAVIGSQSFLFTPSTDTWLNTADFEKINTREAFYKLHFRFSVVMPVNSSVGVYASFTELISITRLLPAPEIERIYQACFKQESWRDRPSML